MRTNERLPQDVLDILQGASLDTNKIKLNCGTIDRALYKQVSEVLEALGGKWKGGKVQAHLFPHDITQTFKIVVETGLMPPKNGLEFFPTPEDLADSLAEGAYLNSLLPNDRILEPSAGDGALVKSIIGELQSFDVSWYTQHRVTAIELNEYLATKLHANFPVGVDVVQGDFLRLSLKDVGLTPFSTIIMNPPFSGKEGAGGDYIAHILHAYQNFLAPGGRLLAIAPAGFTFKSDKRTTAFRELVELKGAWWDNPPDIFKESGTLVKTVTIQMDKGDEPLLSMVQPPVASPEKAVVQLSLF